MYALACVICDALCARSHLENQTFLPSCLPPHMEEETPSWRDCCRRLAKRSDGVEAVKRSMDYHLVTTQHAGCDRPTTPDPCDMSVSKREWERSMCDWRNALRVHAASAVSVPNDVGWD